jgi:hypothetical protein
VNCSEKQPASTPPRSENPISNNLQTNHHNKPADLKTARGRTIRRSTTNTRRDQPSNLIPHDKDHVDDPMSFVPIFHNESNQIYKSSNHAKNGT